MFKFVAICVLVCVGYVAAKSEVQIPPEKAGKLMQDALQCITETGADPALIIQIKDRKYSNDENVKKFLLCAFKKTGVASKKGDVKIDKFLEFYPDEVDKEALKNVVIECQQGDGEPMDKVFSFLKCYQEKTPVRLSLLRH